MDIERVIDIAAPHERVWATIIDVERWPEWTASMTSVEWLERAAFTIGRRARIRQPGLPVVIWTVTALEAGRYVELEAQGTHSSPKGSPRSRRGVGIYKECGNGTSRGTARW